MTFYTAKGDDGTTGLLGEGRVPKYHARMEAIGALDEAMSDRACARWKPSFAAGSAIGRAGP